MPLSAPTPHTAPIVQDPQHPWEKTTTQNTPQGKPYAWAEVSGSAWWGSGLQAQQLDPDKRPGDVTCSVPKHLN